MANLDLSTLAHDLLASVVGRLTAAGIVLPTRRYVWVGAVAVDCEQVVVSYEQSFLGLPGLQDASAIQCSVLRSAQFAISIIRCVPSPDRSGTPPSVESLDAVATVMLTDALELMRQVVTGYRDRDFSSTCDSMSILNVVPVGPSGGYGGVTMHVQVQV